MIKDWINSFIKESFGFESLSSVIKDSFLIKAQHISTFILSLVVSFWVAIWEGLKDYLSGGAGPLSVWLSQNIYDPNQAIKWLFLFVVFDNALGYYKSRSTTLIGGILKTSEGFNSGLFLKSWMRFGIQVAFVAFMFNLSILYPQLQLGLVTHTMMFAFLLATFKSAWDNGYAVGVISEDVYQLVNTVLDLKKFFRIFKSKHFIKEDYDKSKNQETEGKSSKRSSE